MLLFGLLSSTFCRASWGTIIPGRFFFFFFSPEASLGDSHTQGRHWSSHRTAGLTTLLHSSLPSGFQACDLAWRLWGDPHSPITTMKWSFRGQGSQVLNTPSMPPTYDSLCPQQSLSMCQFEGGSSNSPSVAEAHRGGVGG